MLLEESKVGGLRDGKGCLRKRLGCMDRTKEHGEKGFDREDKGDMRGDGGSCGRRLRNRWMEVVK